MNLKEFIEEEKKDETLFWKLSTGERQNLLDEAIEVIEKLEEEIAESEIIKFAIHLTGHDQATIMQMYNDYLR